MTGVPHSKRSLMALSMSVLMLLATVVPFTALVSAANEPGVPDDLVAKITPRGGTTINDALAMASSNNLFTFDFELFHDDGSPYLVTRYGVDVHIIDGRFNSSQDWPTLIWSADVITSATNKGTIRIPAGDIVFYTPEDPNGYMHEFPFGGLALTLQAKYDENGQWLHNGSYPKASYNLAANAAIASGDFENADQLGEFPTPLLLFNGQLSGLAQFGNPLLNPGFEIGYESENFDVPGAGSASMAIPPWFITTDTGVETTSTHYIQGSAGSSGSAVEIRYNTADNGESAHFGQLFFVPGENDTAHWTGTDDVKVSFDMRARVEGGSIPGGVIHGAATLHYNDSIGPDYEAQLTKMPAGGVSVDNAWRSYTLDYGAIADGKRLNSFFFSLNFNDAQVPPGTALVLTIDNVRLTGAHIDGTINPRSDLTDGYSTFIYPTASVDPLTDTADHVVQNLVQLANGEVGYVFRVAAMDYTGIDPETLDVPSENYAVFQMLDATNLPSFADCGFACANGTNRAFFASTLGENSTAFYTFDDAEGNTAKEYLVVVPSGLNTGGVAVGAFIDVETGDTYESNFGPMEPTVGYFSAARNNLRFTHLADTFDYAFTPIQLGTEVGASMARAASISLDCPAMTSTIACTVDPNPLLEVTVSTDSPIHETMTVELVASGDGRVLDSATVATPGGVVPLTVSAADVADLRDNTGDLRVFARLAPTTFVEGASTGLFKLDNVAPVAIIASSDLTGLVRNSVVTFTSDSTDADGEISHYDWKILFHGDPTPDLAGPDDAQTTPFATSNASSISYTLPDDGDFEVILRVLDNGNAADETSLLFSASNVAPTATLTGPTMGRLGQALTFSFAAVDDSIVTSYEVDNGNGTLTDVGNTPLPFTTSFDTPGLKTIRVQAWDDDGASTLVTHDVLIDGVKPTTTLTVAAANLSTTWFTTPVEFTVARGDEGDSGFSHTTLRQAMLTTPDLDDAEFIGLTVENVTGTDNVTRTISGDGIHFVQAYSTDNAGNTDIDDALDNTAVVMIDSSPPSATLVQPFLLDGAPVQGIAVTDVPMEVVASAGDEHSPIVKVELFVDGGAPFETLTEAGEDGLFHFTWIPSGSGFHQLSVAATNAAGLTTLSDTVTVFVL